MQTIQVGLTVPQSKPLIDVLRGVLENSKGRGEQRKDGWERKGGREGRRGRRREEGGNEGKNKRRRKEGKK